MEKLLEVQPALTELGDSLTNIIDRVEQAGKETFSIINRSRELQTQIANLSGCRRILTETIAILDLVQQVTLRSSCAFFLALDFIVRIVLTIDIFSIRDMMLLVKGTFT